MRKKRDDKDAGLKGRSKLSSSVFKSEKQTSILGYFFVYRIMNKNTFLKDVQRC